MLPIDALMRLETKVEAGGHVATQHFEAYWKTGFGFGYNACNENSVEAVQTLHRLELGDRWGIRIWFPNPPELASVELERAPYVDKLSVGKNTVKAIRMPLARAWFLAILKARIAELGA